MRSMEQELLTVTGNQEDRPPWCRHTLVGDDSALYGGRCFTMHVAETDVILYGVDEKCTNSNTESNALVMR